MIHVIDMIDIIPMQSTYICINDINVQMYVRT